jgi:predicted unusual protein kinase regulating ubiquinone biosynthesis (AarF/ABC1/UbiB family)
MQGVLHWIDMLRDTRRVLEILSVFLVYVALYHKAPLWRRLRVAFERLGLVWVKLGQGLAARGVTELEDMWDTTSPLPFEVIRPIIERNVGALDSYFDSFEEKPYASASIAQTHRAVRKGREVMIKVRRPEVLGSMRQDLRIMRRAIWFCSFFSRSIRSLRSARIPEQLESWLLQEVDFVQEKENSILFRRAYPTETLVIPEVEFASEELLVQDFLPGVPCNRWHERYRAKGYDPEASVRALLTETFGPPFKGIPKPVYADPHPANLIIMKGGKMGIVDFGLVGKVTKRELDLMNDAVFAVYVSDTKGVVDALLRQTDFRFKSEAKRLAFERDIEKYVRECRTRSFDYWLIELAKILVRHGVPAMDTFTLICRFGVLGHRITQMFFPGASTFDLVGAEIRAGMWYRSLGMMLEADPVILMRELALRVQRLPNDMAEVVRDPVGVLARTVQTIFEPMRRAA